MATYPVEGTVLTWAREERGLTLPQAVAELRNHLGAEPGKKLEAIEGGHQPPTLGLLRAMASRYEVSLITLFLPEPPPHTEKPNDFRTLEGQTPTLGLRTIKAIRSAQRQQETIAELAEDMPRLHKLTALPAATMKTKPTALAATERQRLGVTFETQHGWVTAGEAFNAWRWLVERLGVLVFRFDLPVDDCRGFSLGGNGKAPVIVVNSEDIDEAQTFTLFHEYAHVLLRRFGLCGQTEDGDYQSLERYANDFAANLLMPASKVIELAELSSLGGNTSFLVILDAAHTVAKYFSVSPRAAVLRLERLGMVPQGSYDEYVDYIRQLGRKRKPRRGRAPYYRRYINKLGSGYVSAVLGALDENLINAVEADDMLEGVKSRHFLDLESDLAERRAKYGTATTA